MRFHALSANVLTRRTFAFCLLGIALSMAGLFTSIASPPQPEPLLERIHTVTISSADPERSAGIYQEHLGYRIVERGLVSEEMTSLWGAHAAAGAPYVMTRAPGDEDAFIRFVEAPANTLAPMTTSGWSAVELLVKDPYSVSEQLSGTPFRQLGAPAPLMEGSSIHAAQFLGPDDEVLYLTADLGPTDGSTLARATTPVGRPFIVVMAQPTAEDLATDAMKRLGLSVALELKLPVPILARAQGFADDHVFRLGLLRLEAFSHAIEVDHYDRAGMRSRGEGHLPSGISLVSFCGSKSLFAATSVTVARPAGVAYSDRAVMAMLLGKDTLIEIIDCG